MPLDMDDVKKLREFTVLGSQGERLDNLLKERIGLLKRNDKNNDRVSEIDGEVAGIENRFRSIARGLRTVLDRLDPPGPPGPP